VACGMSPWRLTIDQHVPRLAWRGVLLRRRLGLERISSPSLIGIWFANDPIGREAAARASGRRLVCQGRREPVVHGGREEPSPAQG